MNREVNASNKQILPKKINNKKGHGTLAVHLYGCLFIPGTKEYE